MRANLYGAPADSYLLLNDGTGNYTASSQPALKELGMITDAVWTDVDQDGQAELITVGEWMPPRVFSWEDGVLVEESASFIPPGLKGWYNTIVAADLDGDGDDDYVLGNHGLNSRFRATTERPVTMHLNDFDQNGKAEQIIATYEGDRAYPLALLHDLNKQMPGLRKRYLRYESFGDQTIEDIFGPEVLARSTILQAENLRSLVLRNEQGRLVAQELPRAAQESPLYAIAVADIDADGDLDLLTGGNFNYAKPEIGRYAADRGDVLLNDGEGNFTAADPLQTGFILSGEVRSIVQLQGRPSPRWLVSRNNDGIQLFLPQAR